MEHIPCDGQDQDFVPYPRVMFRIWTVCHTAMWCLWSGLCVIPPCDGPGLDCVPYLHVAGAWTVCHTPMWLEPGLCAIPCGDWVWTVCHTPMWLELELRAIPQCGDWGLDCAIPPYGGWGLDFSPERKKNPKAYSSMSYETAKKGWSASVMKLTAV